MSARSCLSVLVRAVSRSPLLQRDCLYVADTESHALREVDLRKKSVRTLAGNGTKGAEYAGGAGGAAQALNSPWDVALDRCEGRRVHGGGSKS